MSDVGIAETLRLELQARMDLLHSRSQRFVHQVAEPRRPPEPPKRPIGFVAPQDRKK